MGIKNANGYVGGTVRLTNKKSTANMGIIFNPQTFWISFLKAEPTSAMKAKEA